MRTVGDSRGPSPVGTHEPSHAEATPPERPAPMLPPVVRAAIAQSSAAASAMGGKPAAPAGATVRQFAPGFQTLSTTTLAQLACGAIDSGTLTMDVPLRGGSALIPVSSGEQLEISVAPNTKAIVKAEIVSSAEGPMVAGASIRFEPGIILKNLSALDKRLFVSVAQHFVTATMTGITVDRHGFAKIEGTLVRPALFSDGVDQLSDHAPPLPRVETHLMRYLDGSASAPSLPGLPAPDPHRLLLAFGAIVDKATFDIDVKGKAAVHASGSVARVGRNEFTGEMKGSITGDLACTVELDPESPGVRDGGIGIKQDGGTVTVNACGMDEVKDAVPGVAFLVGTRVAIAGHGDADGSATVRVALTPQGEVSVAATNVKASVSTRAATLTSDKLNVVLGDGAGATASAKAIELGKHGIALKDPSGKVDLKLGSATLQLGNPPA